MKNKKQEKIKNTLKVVVVVLMAAGVALSALAPVFAQDEARLRERVSEVKSILEEITNDISNLPLHETRTVRVSGIPEDFSFRYRQEQGAQGEAVRYLQKVLNLDPETRVAQSGPGSPGNETNLFGPATQSALLRFQQKYEAEVLRPAGLTRASGFMGELTRAKLNDVLRNGVVLKEPVREERMIPIRERFMEVKGMFEELKRDIDKKYSVEEEKTVEICEKDIEEAEKYAEGKLCTLQIKEMSCAGVLGYTARNGCIISFLEERGWE